MMRLLAFDFPEDETALNIDDEYLLGESLLVCPVTEPMYFGAGSKKLEGKRHVRSVYLPRGCGWYDYWTGVYYQGGQWMEADAPLEKLPLFVREGSILPLAEGVREVSELSVCSVDETPLSFRVYGGRDAVLKYYNDSGDGYGYEKGEYTYTEYRWSEAEQRLADGCGRIYECEIAGREQFSLFE